MHQGQIAPEFLFQTITDEIGQFALPEGIKVQLPRRRKLLGQRRLRRLPGPGQVGVKILAALLPELDLHGVHNAHAGFVQLQGDPPQAFPPAGLGVPLLGDNGMGVALQPKVHRGQLLFQLLVHQMAAVGQENGKIIFPPVFLQNPPNRRDGIGGVDIPHLKKQVVPVGLHPDAVVGSQADNQKPLASPLYQYMAPEPGNDRTVVVGGVGTQERKGRQPLEVLAAQVDFVVAQGHGLRTAELHQLQGRFPSVGLDDHTFQIGEISAVQVKVLLPPMGTEVAMHPAEEIKIPMDVVGMENLEKHSIPFFNTAWRTPLPPPR